MNEKVFIDEKFWIEKEGGLSRVGLTKQALDSFPAIDWIGLPSVGKPLEKGGPAVIIESAKAAVDIESPLSGMVREVNSSLIASPKILEESPEETWLFIVEEAAV